MDWGQRRLMLSRQVGGSNLKWTGPGRVRIPPRNSLQSLIRLFPRLMSENFEDQNVVLKLV